MLAVLVLTIKDQDQGVWEGRIPDVGQRAVIIDQIAWNPTGSTKGKGQARDESCRERLQEGTDSLEDKLKDKQEVGEMHRERPSFQLSDVGTKPQGPKTLN